MCSVTLRALPMGEVVSVTEAAGLTSIEWGADIHVPPGDLAAADLAREVTREHGLAVASYGSYVRAGWDELATFGPIVDSAIHLGTPRVRIWAGRAGSREATPEHWRAVIDGTRQATDCAADAGVERAFEFHGGT